MITVLFLQSNDDSLSKLATGISQLNDTNKFDPSKDFDLKSSGASWAAEFNANGSSKESQQIRNEKKAWFKLLRNSTESDEIPSYFCCNRNFFQIRQKLPKQDDFPSLGPAKPELLAPSNFRPTRSKYKGIKVRSV